MSVEKIRFGSLADPDIINQNFSFIEDLINETTAKIYTNNSSLESKISTLDNSINKQVKDLSDKLTGGITEDISNINSNISQINTRINSIFDIIAPNYQAGYEIPSGWTAPVSGYVNWYSGEAGDRSTRRLYINGVEVGYHHYFKYADPHRMQFMVHRGDSISFETGTSAKFFPCRGGV